MEAQEFGNINISDLVPNVNLTKHDIDRVIEDILDDDYLTSCLPECTDVQLVDENGYEMDIDAFSEAFNQFNSSLYPRGAFPTNLSFRSKHEIPLGARHRYFCSNCYVRFSSKTALDMHKRISHNENFKCDILPVNLSSKSYAVSYILYNRNDLHTYKFGQELYNIQKLFDRLKDRFYNDISAGLKLCGPIGVRFCLPSVFQKIMDPLMPQETEGARFHKLVWSNTQIIVMQGNIETALENTVASLQDKVMAYFSEDSYVLTDVWYLRLIVQNCDSITKASYLPLPYVFWKRRELFINVDNSKEAFDQETLTAQQHKLKLDIDLDSSFLFAVAAGIKNAKYSSHRMKTYRKIIRRFNLDGIDFPMTIEQIPKFEQQNRFLQISVFGFYDTGITETSSRFIKNEKNDVVNERLRKSMARCNARDKVITEFSFPLYVSNASKTWDEFGNSKTSRRFKQISKPIVIDLFLLTQVNEDTSEGKTRTILNQHYVLCKDIGSLFRHSNRCKSHLCRQCFQRFKNPETLNVHVNRCFGTMIH